MAGKSNRKHGRSKRKPTDQRFCQRGREGQGRVPPHPQDGPRRMTASLPTEAAHRKAAPMAEGLLYYFPNALAEVARVSKAGNDQHNAGQPLHWARDKSTDHADCIIRHLVDAGTIDTDGQRHTAKVAWRALALLQEELEREHGLPLPRNARFDVIECGGCAPPVIASPREMYEETLAVALGQDRCLYDYMQPPNCDGLSARDVRAPHPMQAEAIRDHDERLAGAEGRL